MENCEDADEMLHTVAFHQVTLGSQDKNDL